jgi:hypothetical protein
MTATSTDPHPDVTPPPGADMVDRWDGDPPGRLIYGADRTVTDHPVRVYPYIRQLSDGSITEPYVYVADGEMKGLGELNCDQARELAAALLETAAEIDRWVK